MPPKAQKWVDIDPNKLSSKQASAYQAYLNANIEEQERWSAFEQAMQEGLPSGKALRVSTQFGRLRVTLTKKPEAPMVSQRSSAQSLKEYLSKISEEE